MTIDQANRLVKKLVGEDDFHDVDDILTSYYDLAQREIATFAAPIRKSIVVKCGEKVALPEDIYRLANVSVSYRRIDMSHIIADGEGEATVCYLAYPKRLTDDSPLTEEFEVCREAQIAIPYFAAAQTVLADSDMRRYYVFMDMFNSILSNVSQNNLSSSKLTVVRTEDIK